MQFNMIKEIKESPKVAKDILSRFFLDDSISIDKEIINVIKEADEVIFIACGTSFHASHLGVNLLIKEGKMAHTYLASEWAYNPIIFGKKPCFILVSQSGETADIIACKKHLEGNKVISITNKRGSTIDKMGDYILPLDCGEEKAIAATKSYVAQCLMIVLLCNAISNDKLTKEDFIKFIDGLNNVLEKEEEIEKLSHEFLTTKDAFLLGRGKDYYAAIEGTLKLKETCYIHSEAYAGGELKHGPVALVSTGVAVFGFISEKETSAIFRNNLEYTKEQNGSLYIISSKSCSSKGDTIVIDDVKDILSPILEVVVIQILAYYISKNKGMNVDNPRSLVKAVTVE